jgi:hypothetical protein
MKFTLRYKDLSKYKYPEFIASKKKEPEEYNRILELQKNILNREPDANTLIYHNTKFKYVIVRILKTTTKFKANSVYELKIQLKKTQSHDDKVFINGLLLKSKLIKDAEPMGADFDISDCDDDSD